MRFDAGPLVVEADANGRILVVAARRRPAQAFLRQVDLGLCVVGGHEVRWTNREVAVDADELSIHLVHPELAVMLRHTFSTGWTTRLLVANPGDRPLVLDRLRLAARPAPEQRASALAAGARLCWAVQSSRGEGPLLAARLLTGRVDGVTSGGFELGALRLAPGQRYVVQWRWDLFATPRSVAIGPGRDVLVDRTAYEVHEAVVLPDDPDAALVVPPGVVVDSVSEAELAGREVLAVVPGHHRIELRSADGDVRLDLSWVRGLTDQLQVWASDVMARPRTSAGVVAVEDLPAALVLQTALGAGGLGDVDQAADALDRVTARLIADPGTEPSTQPGSLAVLYLLGEHGRTGEGEVLAAALQRAAVLLAEDGPAPAGLGLVVLRTVLAGAGREEVTPLVQRAVQRAGVGLGVRFGDAVGDGGGAAEPDSGPVAAGAAELELLLAVRPLLPDDRPTQQRILALVRRLGAALGAGLPGRLLEPPPPPEHAHLVAVLRMLPEEGLSVVTRTWAAPPSLLAHRLTLEVLDRLPEHQVGPAAAWLALAQRQA